MNILWITQVQPDGNDKEIISLEVEDTMWERLHRVFPKTEKNLVSGHVMITLMDGAGENIISDELIIIPDHQGKWMLETFFKLPARIHQKCRQDL